MIYNHCMSKKQYTEEEIVKALDDAHRILIKDKQAFDDFTQNKKKEFRESDLNLDEAIRNNKLIMEKIRKHNSEVHGTEEEIIKNIKEIILYKNYADFIHKLLGKEKINVDVNIIKKNLQNRDRDLIHIIKNVIKQFKFLLDSNEIPVHTEEINNPDLLTALFFSLEGSIIQEMSTRDDIMKEKLKQRLEFDSEILSLQNKIEEDKRQLKTLYKELETGTIGYRKNNHKNILEDATGLICEINEELNHFPSYQKGIKKPIDVIIKNSEWNGPWNHPTFDITYTRSNWDGNNIVSREVRELSAIPPGGSETLRINLGGMKIDNVRNYYGAKIHIQPHWPENTKFGGWAKQIELDFLNDKG